MLSHQVWGAHITLTAASPHQTGFPEAVCWGVVHTDGLCPPALLSFYLSSSVICGLSDSWTGTRVPRHSPWVQVGEGVQTHRQTAHQALLEGALEGSRVPTPVQQLRGGIVEVSRVL